MQVFVKGNAVNLTKREYVASGGEGTIYAKGDEAYKIYHDPSKMIPKGKVSELQRIHSDRKVIMPLQYVLDKNNKTVGYTMRFVRNTYTLCQLFPIAFKNRNSLNPTMCMGLVRNMQNTLQNIHNAGVLVVDLNEMNLLVDENFTEVYFIDTDSYQTKTYPATAIMESIRDRHTPTNSFNTGSDWFSFGIVSFQLLTGIHPYKGKHPFVTTMDDRMKANISVFNKDVRVPKSCGSFNIIPEAYRDWYKAIFDDQKRVAPPTSLVTSIVVPQVKQVTGDNTLDIREVNINYDFGYSNKRAFVKTARQYRTVDIQCRDSRIFFQEDPNGPAITENNGVFGDQVMTYDGRAYLKLDDSIMEVDFVETKKLIPKLMSLTKILPQATRMYDGVVIQALLGQCYASIYPESKKSYQIKLPELSGYKIVDAKFEKDVLVIVAGKNGVYDKFRYFFTDGKHDSYKSYRLTKVEDVTNKDINFTVIDKGILVEITDTESLRLEHLYSRQVTEVSSAQVSMDMRLFSRGNDVYFEKKGKTYSIKTK